MVKIVVDPVTRIEGHLRIEAETAPLPPGMSGDGLVTRAASSGTMIRGIETILQGLDPREAWAFTQRFCGVCTLVHALAAVRAVEHALDYPIPPNAHLIRNLMLGTQYVHDHVMHFYHLHAFDWVDLVSAAEADPAETARLQQSISDWPRNSREYFAGVLQQLKDFIASGQLGILKSAAWEEHHPAYRLPPHANLLAFAHYLEVLAWQREVVKLHAVFGGKNPHPNIVVGGMPCAISIGSNERASQFTPASEKHLPPYFSGLTAFDEAGLVEIAKAIQQMQNLVDQVFIPDTLLIADYYKGYQPESGDLNDWSKIGEGVGNFLTFAEFGTSGGGGFSDPLIPQGAIIDRNLSKVHAVDPQASDEIQEFTSHSWYEAPQGKDTPLHPYDGETLPHYTEPSGGEDFDVSSRYSWIKSPRWQGKVMETGPLARVNMLLATGNAHATRLVDDSLHTLGLDQSALYSTLGRTLARNLETKLIADALPDWQNALLSNIHSGDCDTFNDSLWDPALWPANARGVGLVEAPRGALAHYIVIEDRCIRNYQAVVPTTWNASPRDASNQAGPMEMSLVDHRVYDRDHPIELLRTIHTFDPCIACAVHVSDIIGEGRGDLNRNTP